MSKIRKQYLRSLIAGLVLALGLVMPVIPSSASNPPALGVHITPIGSPTWKPVDFHLFAAPVGTATSGYVEFFDTQLALLPSPNHVPHPALGIGPGLPHLPPYNSEFANSIASLGYHEGLQFNRSEFSNGSGIFLVWTNVPSPGITGSSPDFATGPIIPNSLFPIHVTLSDTHNNKLFSAAAAFDVPPLDASLSPPFFVDGHSHFPVFIADNADFILPTAHQNLLGSYEYLVVMTDSSGNGWRIKAHFTLAP